MDIDFPNASNKCLPAFLKKLCVHVGIPVQCSGSLKLFSLHFLLAQDLKVSQRWEVRVFSQVFPVNMHSLANARGLLDSQEYGRVFQSSLWTSHSPALSFKFLIHHWVSWPQAATILNNYHWKFFDKCPRKKAICTEFFMRSNKDKLCEWRFSGSCRTGQITTVLWEWRIWGDAPAPLYSLQWLLGSCFSHPLWSQGYWFSRLLCNYREKKMQIGEDKMPQSSVFLSRVTCFSSINVTQIFASVWLISRILKTLILTILGADALIAFMWEQIFRGPYSTIPEEFLLFQYILKLLV